MALFRQSCTCVLFLMVTGIHVQAQNADCHVNDENPRIEENNPPGSVVTTVEKGPGVTVTIDSANSEHLEFFEINGTQLILNHSLDYETTQAIYVRLNCWKNGAEVNSVDIFVSVINVNDNPPVFKEANITVSVNEDTKVYTTVVPQANVTATDADVDRVDYSLIGSPPEATDYFSIQGVNNPEIYLRKALDYEKINFMKLTLYAMDGSAGAPGVHTATATITIHIVQADLRPPWFQPCTFTADHKVCFNRGYTGMVNVSEMMMGPLILNPGPVYAVDGDISLNEQIEYSIVDGNDNDTFSINRDTGNITMNRTVNILKTFVLYIMASQANNPFRFSQTTVEIKVVRRNNHKPYFEKSTYLGTVSVGLPVSSLVMDAGFSSTPLRIFAADEDFPDKVNPDIKYQIQNSTDFTIGKDGFLLTTVILNSSSTTTLLVIATDETTLEKASTLIVIDITSLPSTTTFPTTTSTSTTTATPKTTISNPSGSSSTPGINNTLSTIPYGSSTMSPAGTTTNAGLTGRPVANTTSGSSPPSLVTTKTPPVITGNTTQTQTSRSPITGISQATAHTLQPTTQTTALSLSGSTKSPTTTTVGISLSTASTSSKSESFKPSTTTNGTINSTASSSTAVTTTLPTNQTPKSTTTAVTTTLPTNQTPKSTTTASTTTVPTNQTSISTITAGTTTLSTNQTPKSTTTAGTTTLSTNQTSNSTITAVTTTLSTNQTSNSTTRSVTSITTASSVSTQISSTSNRFTGSMSLPASSAITTAECECDCDRDKKDVVIIGATLGSLLAITLVLLGLISCKYYRTMKQKDGEDSEHLSLCSTNHSFQEDEKLDSGEKDDKSLASDESESNEPFANVRLSTPPLAKKAVESSQASSDSEGIEEDEEGKEGSGSEKEVKSILTKDRRLEDDGYKAVWFKNTDPEAKDDVVMIEVDSDTEQNRNDSDGDEGGDEDEEDEEDDRDSGRGGSNMSIPVILSGEEPNDDHFHTVC